MTLKCSAEPKRRDVAQIAVFAAKSEPIWLKDKIHPKGQESDFQYRAAQRYAEIPVSDSRFSLCPAGCVSRFSKQGLCVLQKTQSQPKSADSLGRSPLSPERRDVYGERYSYCSPGDGKGERDKFYASDEGKAYFARWLLKHPEYAAHSTPESG